MYVCVLPASSHYLKKHACYTYIHKYILLSDQRMYHMLPTTLPICIYKLISVYMQTLLMTYRFPIDIVDNTLAVRPGAVCRVGQGGRISWGEDT